MQILEPRPRPAESDSLEVGLWKVSEASLGDSYTHWRFSNSILLHFPELTGEAEPHLPSATTSLAFFPLLVHIHTPLTMLPDVTSKIHDLYSNPCLRGGGASGEGGLQGKPCLGQTQVPPLPLASSRLRRGDILDADGESEF